MGTSLLSHARPGDVLLTRVYGDGITSTRPRATGWQVVTVNALGGYDTMGAPCKRRSEAEALARATFPDIERWRSVGFTAFLAQRRPTIP